MYKKFSKLYGRFIKWLIKSKAKLISYNIIHRYLEYLSIWNMQIYIYFLSTLKNHIVINIHYKIINLGKN